MMSGFARFNSDGRASSSLQLNSLLMVCSKCSAKPMAVIKVSEAVAGLLLSPANGQYLRLRHRYKAPSTAV